jgi:hypothetical protein
MTLWPRSPRVDPRLLNDSPDIMESQVTCQHCFQRAFGAWMVSPTWYVHFSRRFYWIHSFIPLEFSHHFTSNIGNHANWWCNTNFPLESLCTFFSGHNKVLLFWVSLQKWNVLGKDVHRIVDCQVGPTDGQTVFPQTTSQSNVLYYDGSMIDPLKGQAQLDQMARETWVQEHEKRLVDRKMSEKCQISEITSDWTTSFQPAAQVSLLVIYMQQTTSLLVPIT